MPDKNTRGKVPAATPPPTPVPKRIIEREIDEALKEWDEDSVKTSYAEKPSLGSLFQRGSFTLHSGLLAKWKIDCDSLSDEDIESLAIMALELLPPFGSVEGIPRGGVRLANAMRPFAQTAAGGPVLIVDDVLTTGRSMEVQRGDRVDALGLVIFARGEVPSWIIPIWRFCFAPKHLSSTAKRDAKLAFYQASKTLAYLLNTIPPEGTGEAAISRIHHQYLIRDAEAAFKEAYKNIK